MELVRIMTEQEHKCIVRWSHDMSTLYTIEEMYPYGGRIYCVMVDHGNGDILTGDVGALSYLEVCARKIQASDFHGWVVYGQTRS